MKRVLPAACIALAATLAVGTATGSSHREAPLITALPKVDNTDFYMFRSYEPGREAYVTLIANFQPLQDAYGGPNYFLMDETALYSIHIDNNGDAREDLSFHFRFANNRKGLTVPVNGMNVPVPLSNIGPFGSSPEQEANRNVVEAYGLATVRAGRTSLVRNLSLGTNFFYKPFDNIGAKSIPDYAAYADRHIYRAAIDGCASDARVFAGQRREGFAVNLGEVFDLVNTDPVGPRDGERNVIADKNITTIAIEVPIACLTSGGNPIIGAWSTASLPRGFLRDSVTVGPQDRRTRHIPYQQVSRLSAPLVNEVVIGLPDKDRFNASHPRDDGQFAKYVTNPTLPVLIEALFPGVQAPRQYPRTDLVAAFLTGVPGLNQPEGVRPAEMLRLNTGIAPRAAAAQDSLAVLAGDTAGFPNGRRPGDDVVDIALRVAMGVLLPEDVAPAGRLPYTDGAIVSAADFQERFPYLVTPVAGSPN